MSLPKVDDDEVQVFRPSRRSPILLGLAVIGLPAMLAVATGWWFLLVLGLVAQGVLMWAVSREMRHQRVELHGGELRYFDDTGRLRVRTTVDRLSGIERGADRETYFRVGEETIPVGHLAKSEELIRLVSRRRGGEPLPGDAPQSKRR